MSQPVVHQAGDYEKQTALDEKQQFEDVDIASTDDGSEVRVLDDARDIATHVITVHDDPSLSPWTVRAFVIGIGLSTFGGVLGMCLERTLLFL